MIGNEKQIASDVITAARKLQNCLAMYNTANTVNKDYYYIDFYDKLENLIDRVKSENNIDTDFQDTWLCCKDVLIQIYNIYKLNRLEA